MSERAKTRAKMERLISRWKDSGRSCTAFAEANGVSVAKFLYWKRRLDSVEPKGGRKPRRASTASQPGFVPVQLVGTASAAFATGGMVELVLESGERVRVTEGVSEDTLRRAIRVLRERDSC